MSALIIGPNETDERKIAFVIQQLAQGRSNAVGSFTLRANQTTTTVTAQNCGEGSTPIITPTSASAAAASGTTYVSAVNNGSFVVTHTSDAAVDRTFLYAAFG